MSLRPMPSPRGTNHSQRFVVGRSLRGAAYDEAPKLSDEAALDLLEFLRDKLNEADLAAFCKMAGIDDAVTMDNEGGPEPFRGMPERGGGQAQDRRRRSMAADTARSLAQRFPHAAAIKVSSATGY